MARRTIQKNALDEADRLVAESELSQSAIAARVGVNQSTISRRFWVKFRQLMKKERAERIRSDRLKKHVEGLKENLRALDLEV